MIKTSCKDCAFAVFNNHKQTSCLFNRIQIFDKDANMNEEEDVHFYTINRLCTYYRNTSWGYSQKDTNKVIEESALKFDIIFDCTHINNDQAEIILHFINTNKYYPSRVNFFLLHEYSYYDRCKEYISQIAQKSKHKVNISICEKIEFYMHQLALKSKSGYHIFVKHPELLELDTLSRINNLINNDLKKFIVCGINDTYAVANVTYKFANSVNNSSLYFENLYQITQYCKSNSMYIEL